MTLKEQLHAHAPALKKTGIVVGAVGTVVGITLLGAKTVEYRTALHAAINVITDLGGNAPELIADKITGHIRPVIEEIVK